MSSPTPRQRRQLGRSDSESELRPEVCTCVDVILYVNISFVKRGKLMYNTSVPYLRQTGPAGPVRVTVPRAAEVP
jgi:hypothetical protein